MESASVKQISAQIIMGSEEEENEKGRMGLTMMMTEKFPTEYQLVQKYLLCKKTL